MHDVSLVPHPRAAPKKRKIEKVPFVELFGGRLQGVVSSGSSLERVYVSFVDAGELSYSCRTNNNRPCGGLRGGPCKHLQALVDNAVAQYGAARVARHLRLPGSPEDYTDARAVMAALPSGKAVSVQASEVFSRFLHYLRYVELEPSRDPAAEMSWFVTG